MKKRKLLTRKRKKQIENAFYRSFLRDWKDDVEEDDGLLLSVVTEEDYDYMCSHGLLTLYLNAKTKAQRFFRRKGKLFAIIPESEEFANRLGFSEEKTPNALHCVREFEEMNNRMPGEPKSILE